MKKRILSLLLALAMVLGMVPVMAGAATADPQITKVSMTLSGVLDVNFKVASNGADMTGVGVNVTVGETVQSITEYTKDGDLYVYTAKLPAHRLGEALAVELVSGETVCQSITWTAADYLAQVKAQSSDYAAIAEALENYGSYAAAYAAGESISIESVDAVTAADLEDYKHSVAVKNGTGLKPVTSLYLDDACDLLIKFNAEAFGESILYIDDAEAEVAVVDDQVVCTLSELLPQAWSHMYDIKVVSGEEVIFQCSYSVLSYAAIVLAKDTEPATDLNGLLKAMYLYSVEAAALAPSVSTPVALGSFFLRDPYVLNTGDAYYLYGTQSNGGFKVWTSTDLSMWYDGGYCLTLEEGDEYYDATNSEVAFWAPEVHEYNGAYYMFASFTQAGTGNQQGTAIFKAESPMGPFEKWSDGFVTPSGHSCLDGTLYVENGVPYMIYAHEYQCSACNDDMGSIAYIQLTDDLKASTGDAVELFEAKDLTNYSWFETVFGKDNANVTDGPFVYTDENGQKYLLWSTSVDDGNYVQVYTTFDSLSGGINAGSNSVQVYTDDGGHGMIFTDMNGIDKLILHTPNTGASRAALFNVTVSGSTLSLEGVRIWDGYGLSTAQNYGSDIITENTTVFIGDSFFDPSFWNNFAIDLTAKDAKIYGIGGSTTEDWYHYAELDALLGGSGVAPKNIVVNLGNNDYYNDGLTAEEALENYIAYYTLLHENYPNASIYAFSTVARTGSFANATAEAELTEGNSLLSAWCAEQDYITFIDITGLIPSGGLYDGIHPYDEYYNSVYLAKLIEAGCVIENEAEGALFHVYSQSGNVTADRYEGTLSYQGQADTELTSELYFMANASEAYAKNWELTGTITKEDMAAPFYFSFGVRDEAGNDQWFCLVNEGTISMQRYWNWYENRMLLDGVYILENAAADAFFGASENTSAVLNYKAVLEGDMLKVYFGNVSQSLQLSWVLDLTKGRFGGFDAGSSYQMAVNTDATGCTATISHVTVTTSNDAVAVSYEPTWRNGAIADDNAMFVARADRIASPYIAAKSGMKIWLPEAGDEFILYGYTYSEETGVYTYCGSAGYIDCDPNSSSNWSNGYTFGDTVTLGNGDVYNTSDLYVRIVARVDGNTGASISTVVGDLFVIGEEISVDTIKWSHTSIYDTGGATRFDMGTSRVTSTWIPFDVGTTITLDDPDYVFLLQGYKYDEETDTLQHVSYMDVDLSSSNNWGNLYTVGSDSASPWSDVEYVRIVIKKADNSNGEVPLSVVDSLHITTTTGVTWEYASLSDDANTVNYHWASYNQNRYLSGYIPVPSGTTITLNDDTHVFLLYGYNYDEETGTYTGTGYMDSNLADSSSANKNWGTLYTFSDNSTVTHVRVLIKNGSNGNAAVPSTIGNALTVTNAPGVTWEFLGLTDAASVPAYDYRSDIQSRLVSPYISVAAGTTITLNDESHVFLLYGYNYDEETGTYTGTGYMDSNIADSTSGNQNWGTIYTFGTNTSVTHVRVMIKNASNTSAGVPAATKDALTVTREQGVTWEYANIQDANGNSDYSWPANEASRLSSAYFALEPGMTITLNDTSRVFILHGYTYDEATDTYTYCGANSYIDCAPGDSSTNWSTSYTYTEGVHFGTEGAGEAAPDNLYVRITIKTTPADASIPAGISNQVTITEAGESVAITWNQSGVNDYTGDYNYDFGTKRITSSLIKVESGTNIKLDSTTHHFVMYAYTYSADTGVYTYCGSNSYFDCNVADTSSNWGTDYTFGETVTLANGTTVNTSDLYVRICIRCTDNASETSLSVGDDITVTNP